MFLLRSSLTVAFIFSSLLPLAAVEIIAHRGASNDAPENTLSALRLGFAQGADAGELDIYRTKDGQAILLHDATTKRTTNADLKVADSTLAELRALDAGSWKGAAWAGEKLPTLAEALATIPDGKRMFIEIKCGPEVLPEVERVIKASGKKPEQLVLIGFNYQTMLEARARLPQAPIYWLSSSKGSKDNTAPPAVEELIAKAKAARFDGLNLHYKFPIDAAFVRKVKDAGLGLYAWTVNEPEIAKSLAVAGVDGITTDRPGFPRAQLK